LCEPSRPREGRCKGQSQPPPPPPHDEDDPELEHEEPDDEPPSKDEVLNQPPEEDPEEVRRGVELERGAGRALAALWRSALQSLAMRRSVSA